MLFLWAPWAHLCVCPCAGSVYSAPYSLSCPKVGTNLWLMKQTPGFTSVSHSKHLKAGAGLSYCRNVRYTFKKWLSHFWNAVLKTWPGSQVFLLQVSEMPGIQPWYVTDELISFNLAGCWWFCLGLLRCWMYGCQFSFLIETYNKLEVIMITETYKTMIFLAFDGHVES